MDTYEQSEARKKSKAAWYRAYYQQNKERILEQQRSTRKARKPRITKAKQIVMLLGGKCIRCGFDDIRALQVDHVDGGGREEQRKMGTQSKQMSYILREVRAGSSQYQVLCANCNWIKRAEHREYHQPCPVG